MLEQARARGVYDGLRTAEVTEALGASTESHDLVDAADVLIYFGALEPLFERVARRLAPGGLFAFTVEKSEGEGYRLAPTGRYAHSLGYLRGCARAAGLAPVVEREAVLRTERGQPVPGHVVVLGGSSALSLRQEPVALSNAGPAEAVQRTAPREANQTSSCASD